MKYWSVPEYRLCIISDRIFKVNDTFGKYIGAHCVFLVLIILLSTKG